MIVPFHSEMIQPYENVWKFFRQDKIMTPNKYGYSKILLLSIT
jgi:hypothetical protein